MDDTIYVNVYQPKHMTVTPYMHILPAHIPKLLRGVGSLALFSQQGLEKFND